ncbi:MAG: hypothetical protein IKD10_12100 [Lentisphaeria bacterium]|nr:hypothetical protein [Lentisphaeria bacterium]
METNPENNRDRRIGFRDETEGDYGFRDYRHDGSYDMHPTPANGNAMQRGHVDSRMDGKTEKWERLLQKIKMHDVKHRTPETIGDIVSIVYDNLPGPNQTQAELLVAVFQAIAMHCSKDK